MDMNSTQRYRGKLRRRYSGKEPKSIGKAYAYLAIGCFFLPGLHRFYLERRKTAFLMIGLILAALFFSVMGVNAIYAPYLEMILGKPGAHGNADEVLKDAQSWFYAAAGCGVAAYIWIFIDLFLIPRMAREP